MTRPRKRRDPMDRVIESALQPGRYVDWNEGFAFVSDLRHCESEIAKLTAAHPARAVALYEAFLAGCDAKAEEVDDSDGEFGTFAGGLYCGWITARQAARSDPGETVRLMLGWMDDDWYGFCNDLELSAVKVLDKAGLQAFESEVRTRFDKERTALNQLKRPAAPNASYARDRWSAMLKAVYSQRRDAGKYIELTSQTGLTQADCEAIATMFQTRRKPAEALAWVERGIAMEKPNAFGRGISYKLGEMRRALLVRLDRGGEALNSAWAEFEAQPGKFAYEELLRYVPKASAGRGIKERWMPRARAIWTWSSSYGSARRRSRGSPNAWTARATQSWKVCAIMLRSPRRSGSPIPIRRLRRKSSALCACGSSAPARASIS